MEKKTINSSAPIRICDIGGWTDTWFAEHGNIFNIGVYPFVEVQINAYPQKNEERIHITLENFDEQYSVDPNRLKFDKHPLIEAAIDVMDIPKEIEFDVNIYSSAPPGASTGTSAAVSVALIGALDRLTPGRLTAHEVGSLAHYIETNKLGLQSGIQDQLCSAYGGINYIEMQRYPYASISPVVVPNSIWWELESRLLLVYIGTPHSSSDIHKKVIKDLGNDSANDPRLETMRGLAREAKNAVQIGDFFALGEIMSRNTEAQEKLHRDLVCEKFHEIMDICRRKGTLGYKVNGAGGDGGSMTILLDGRNHEKRKLAETLKENGFKIIDIYLSRYGLRVW